MEMDWLLPNSRKNEVWREGRKLLDRSLRPGATISYRQMMQEITRGFLAQLRATPREFRSHISLSVVIRLLCCTTFNGHWHAAFRENSSCLLRMDTT